MLLAITTRVLNSLHTVLPAAKPKSVVMVGVQRTLSKICINLCGWTTAYTGRSTLRPLLRHMELNSVPSRISPRRQGSLGQGLVSHLIPRTHHLYQEPRKSRRLLWPRPIQPWAPVAHIASHGPLSQSSLLKVRSTRFLRSNVILGH